MDVSHAGSSQQGSPRKSHISDEFIRFQGEHAATAGEPLGKTRSLTKPNMHRAIKRQLEQVNRCSAGFPKHAASAFTPLLFEDKPSAALMSPLILFTDDFDALHHHLNDLMSCEQYFHSAKLSQQLKCQRGGKKTGGDQSEEDQR